MAKKKHRGHYCRICGDIKPNEKFSGKGHAAHICKSCASLPVARRMELQLLNRIAGMMFKPFLTKENRSLLKKYAKDDRYPELKEYAQSVLDGFDNPSAAGMDDIDDEDVFYDDDIDNLPVFSEKKKFTELDKDEKTLLRDYIRSQIMEHWESLNTCPNENELVEIKKRMTGVFEEECHIILKNDATLRKFFQDNATATIDRLQRDQKG